MSHLCCDDPNCDYCPPHHHVGQPPTVPMLKAIVGEEAYTWENPSGDWGGDYTFETVDPRETLDAYDLAEYGTVTRKRWRLIAVTEIDVTLPTDDEEACDA